MMFAIKIVGAVLACVFGGLFLLATLINLNCPEPKRSTR